jgi:hypothetical protein
MTTKRTPIARNRKSTITPEMIELFRRGREIQEVHANETWEEEGGRRAEFLAISKKLDWELLGRAPHEVSVLGDLEGEPPGYMAARNSPSNPDFNGWFSGRELQKRLAEAAGGT